MVRQVLIAVAAVSACSLAFANEVSQDDRSIRDLDVLIGKWRYVDESTELAGFEYRETGFTECVYAVDDAYIRCDGEGIYDGKRRTFVEYINYNRFSGKFQRVGMFGNHPAIASFSLEVSSDGRKIEQRGAPMQQRDGTYTRNWGVITFSDDDHYVWHVHINRSNEAPDHWPLKFISTFKRVVD